MKEAGSPPILVKYLKAFKQNPKSKVFAPLAEVYRKMGMLDEAMQVLKTGIKNHPTYTMGYLSLASCYFDSSKFDLAYNTLRPLVAQNMDNLLMQRLFANTCLKMGHSEEALESFKYLLFINPKDQGISQIVHDLEDKLQICLEEDDDESNEVYRASFNTSGLDGEGTYSDWEGNTQEWVNVDFSRVHDSDEGEFNRQEWVQEKSHEPKLLEKSEPEPVENRDEPILPRRYPEEDSISEQEVTDEDEPEAIDLSPKKIIDKKLSVDEENSIPVMTQTLVDLYCKQGHQKKAIEILQKLLELNPDDDQSSEKLQALLSQSHPDEGHTNLMGKYDNYINEDPRVEVLEKLFHSFLQKIKAKSGHHFQDS